jgi:hypothetical protein
MNAPHERAPGLGDVLPSARHGVRSVLALTGTGRLQLLRRHLCRGPASVDRFGSVAGLEHHAGSLRRAHP